MNVSSSDLWVDNCRKQHREKNDMWHRIKPSLPAHLHKYSLRAIESHQPCFQLSSVFPPIPLFGLVAIITDIFCWKSGNSFRASINSAEQCRYYFGNKKKKKKTWLKQRRITRTGGFFSSFISSSPHRIFCCWAEIVLKSWISEVSNIVSYTYDRISCILRHQYHRLSLPLCPSAS